MDIKEGYMPFKGYRTYYRIVGKGRAGKTPLLLLHGGPGSTHNSLEVLDDLAADGRMLVYYDQLGCGLSSVEGSHPELWNKETWCEELMALRKFLGLDKIHLLGHSWGGMLAITYVSDYKPQGLKSVILSSTLPSSSLWATEAHRLIRASLPEWAQKAIATAEATKKWDDPDYLRANELFVREHIGGPWGPDDPSCLTRPKISGSEAYSVAWGPNEYNPLGNLSNWEYLNKMKEWDIPTLINDGAEDESTPYINMQMHKAVRGSEWNIFEFSRHMSYVEEHGKYIAIVKDFLNRCD